MFKLFKFPFKPVKLLSILSICLSCNLSFTQYDAINDKVSYDALNDDKVYEELFGEMTGETQQKLDKEYTKNLGNLKLNNLSIEEENAIKGKVKNQVSDFFNSPTAKKFLEDSIKKAESERGLLTGDTKLSCEAILCLSDPIGWNISDCLPSLHRFYNIDPKHWHDKVKERRRFLNLCPLEDDNNRMETQQRSDMNALKDSLANNAGGCDISVINRSFSACPDGGIRKHTKTDFFGETTTYYTVSECKTMDFNTNVVGTARFQGSTCGALYRLTFTNFKNTQPQWECKQYMTRGEMILYNQGYYNMKNSRYASNYLNNLKRYKQYRNINFDEKVCVKAEWFYPQR